MPIHAEGPWFKDETNRARILRGLNLSGESKMPASPPGYTHLPDSLKERRNVSFVNRPFPLDQADEHFGRLKHWGLDFLRLLVTWEALEHDGPGIYDQDYLDYIEALIEKAQQHDINLFIDPHQDVWSRFTGGDGAPAWTLEHVGLSIDSFEKTGAAITHQQRTNDFHHLIWASNYNRFACLTMFTLFFGGNHFAPNRQCNGESIQDFLQGHYIRAYQRLAQRLNHLPNVLGFGTMNEPSPGLIGVQDLRSAEHILIKLEITPSPAEAIFLASGFEQTCLDFGQPLVNQLPGRASKATINPEGQRAWQDDCEDIWREHGIWDTDQHGQPRILRPSHFARADFLKDFLKPFTIKFATAIQQAMPTAHIFIEAEPLAPPPQYDSHDKLVYAPHFYDPATLLSKRFHPRFNIDLFNMRPLLGKQAIQNYFHNQYSRFQQFADQRMNGAPVLIGEFGIPFDLNRAGASQSNDFTTHSQALEYHFAALDKHLMNATIWNYSPNNTHTHGDNWNGEDFSIFSRDQQSDPSSKDSGGRALQAIVRPCAKKIAGTPLSMRFDPDSQLFTFTFRHDSHITEPTEIFVPSAQYPSGYTVEVSDGTVEILADQQRVLYRHSSKDMPHMIRIISNTPPPPQPSPRHKLTFITLALALLLFLLRQSSKTRDKR